MTELELTQLMMPLIDSMNLSIGELNIATSFIALTIAIGIGLGYYESIQDSIGIAVIIMTITHLLGINNLYWLTILLALTYGLMSIAKQGE